MTPATLRKREQLAHFIRLKLEPEPAVQGVLGVGSIATGTAHEGSDIDAVVFLHPFDPYIVPAESIWREADDSFHSIFSDDTDLQANGLQLDFKRLDWRIWHDSAQEWTEPMRAELGNAWVAFDRNGEVERLINERSRYDSKIRLARLDEAIVWLDLLLNNDEPEQSWKTLGPVIAHDRLQAAYEYLAQALFAYNKRWRTWKTREMTVLLQLPWRPKSLDSHLLTALNAPSHDQAGFSARATALGCLFREILDRLMAERIYGQNPVSEAFIRSHEEPGRAWNMRNWNVKHQTRMSGK